MPTTRTDDATQRAAVNLSPTSMVAPAKSPTQVLVAIHGIGDQIAYATVQSVALRVSTYRGRMVATPLGRFYREPTTGKSSVPIVATPQLMLKEDGAELADLVFAEAYWAPIAREVANEKFVLEEAKSWGRSIAARVAYHDGDGVWPRAKVERLVVVLDELVETIRILERLTFLADKAGVFKFDLAELLVDFVGDVQIVADFERYREEIIERFDTTMTASLAAAPTDREHELYLVAHSEGTVITLIALLEALTDPTAYPWIRNVRGLMTIGSPIEVHHLLWPSLWQIPQKDGKLTPSADAMSVKIPWHNYMDYGDPIAYDLAETTKWLDETGFGAHLSPTTHAFSRYPLPGKAHVDYWSDPEVFGHFFEHVVKLPRDGEAKPSENVTRAVNAVTGAKGAVRSRPWVPIFTFALPYSLVAILLITGVYALEHAVGSALQIDPPMWDLTRDVLGIGTLMFGITAASRLPRIADGFQWTVRGWLILAASMLLFAWAATPGAQHQMGGQLAGVLQFDPSPCQAEAVHRSLGCGGGDGLASHTLAIWIVAALVTLASSFASKRFPRYGHYLLPVFGLIAAVFIVVGIVTADTPTSASLWPLLIGGAFFFYLWWLSGMLFDLTFIWRRYTRASGIGRHLAKLARSTGGRPV